MLSKQVVVNASPLIALFRAGLHPLLPQLFADICVPEAVWNEAMSNNHDDAVTQQLPQMPWIHLVTVNADDKERARNNFGFLLVTFPASFVANRIT